jgi:hypothetical protein
MTTQKKVDVRIKQILCERWRPWKCTAGLGGFAPRVALLQKHFSWVGEIVSVIYEASAGVN